MAKHGDFVWYDLMTSDQDAAKAFYTETIGWKTEVWEEMGYTLWAAGERTVGGLMDPLAKDAPPQWLAYVRVDDMPATAKKITELGGKVLKDVTEIPDMGSFAIVTDPEGAVFALYSGRDSDEEPQPVTGDFAWHELMAKDWEKAWSFYSALFGWTRGEAMDLGEMGTYQLFEADGRTVGGMMTNPTDTPAYWLYYASVDNVDDALDRIKRQGGEVVHGPVEVPGGDRVAQCLDPQGAAFAVYQRAG